MQVSVGNGLSSASEIAAQSRHAMKMANFIGFFEKGMGPRASVLARATQQSKSQ
jgi:hypothetical protein